MDQKHFYIALLLLLLPQICWSQGHADRRILEQKRELLVRHQARLESLLLEQGKRITRLKSQRSGVQRNVQLNTALRENQSLATKLTDLREQIRLLTEQLNKAYDQALGATKDPALKAQLARQKALLNQKTSLAQTRIVTQGKATLLDSPDDLDEKADLLQDSEEKVKRQLKRVKQQLALLMHREKLMRHGRTMDDSPFYEGSPRRTGQVKRVVSKADGRSEGDAAEVVRVTPPVPSLPKSSLPAPAEAGSIKSNDYDAPPTTSSFGEDDGALPPPSYGGGTTTLAPSEPSIPGRSTNTREEFNDIVMIRDVMDPSLLQDLSRLSKGAPVKNRISALKSAQDRLTNMVHHLSQQAKKLRRRAADLRLQK